MGWRELGDVWGGWGRVGGARERWRIGCLGAVGSGLRGLAAGCGCIPCSDL